MDSALSSNPTPQPLANMPSLFSGETSPSEADLMGLDFNPGDSENGQATGEEIGDPQPKVETEEAAESESEEEAATEGTSKDSQKVVPLAALKEARAERKALAAEVEQMRATMAELKSALEAKNAAPAQPQAPKEVAIPVDIEDEFQELLDLDPEVAKIAREDSPEGARLRKLLDTSGASNAYAAGEAIRGRRELQAEKQNWEKEKAKQVEREARSRQQAEVDAELADLRQAAPELFDDDGHFSGETEGSQRVVAFAKQQGLATGLTLLTNPDTVIVTAEGNRPLGKIAVQFVKLLANAVKLSPDSALEAGKVAGVAEVTRKLTQGQNRAGTSLNNMPRSQGAGKPAVKTYASMTEAERLAYLAGQD